MLTVIDEIGAREETAFVIQYANAEYRARRYAIFGSVHFAAQISETSSDMVKKQSYT